MNALLFCLQYPEMVDGVGGVTTEHAQLLADLVLSSVPEHAIILSLLLEDIPALAQARRLGHAYDLFALV